MVYTGPVVALPASSDNPGSVRAREEYFPYGKASDRRDERNRYRYIGVECDATTGLHMAGPRTYCQMTGRFLQADSVLDPKSSPYEYARSRPMTLLDPTGYSPNQAGTTTSAEWEAGLNGLVEVGAIPHDDGKISRQTILDIYTLDSKEWIEKYGGTEDEFKETVGAFRAENMFLYSESYGYIDIRHFFTGGEVVYTEVLNRVPGHDMAAGVALGALTFLFENAQLASGNESGWSPEDVASNYLGAAFALAIHDSTEYTYRREDTDIVSLSVSFFDSIGTTTPESAPNWDSLPANHEQTVQGRLEAFDADEQLSSGYNYALQAAEVDKWRLHAGVSAGHSPWSLNSDGTFEVNPFGMEVFYEIRYKAILEFSQYSW